MLMQEWLAPITEGPSSPAMKVQHLLGVPDETPFQEVEYNKEQRPQDPKVKKAHAEWPAQHLLLEWVGIIEDKRQDPDKVKPGLYRPGQLPVQGHPG